MTFKVQIDDVVRDATPDEIALIESIQNIATAEEQAAQKQGALASVRNKLSALGLSEAEIKALVG